MNVLLVDPPSASGDVLETEGRNKLTTPNMGLMYIGTYIRNKEKINVRIIDPQLFDFREENILELLNDFKPQLVGISSKTFNVEGAYAFASLVKRQSSSTTVAVGGAHPTALPNQVLLECENIDIVVIREGEITFAEVCKMLSSSNASEHSPEVLFSNIPGIAWRNKYGEVLINRERELIADLDTLPFPDLSLIDYKKYARVYNPVKHVFQYVYPVFGSRGCPFNCSFCMPLLTRKHRVRSIENIIEEVSILYRRYGARRIYFEDSLFCTSEKWFGKFCDEYKKAGLHEKVQWGFETRIDTVNFHLFKLAVNSGCIYTFFGVESGNEEVLRKNNKKYKRDDIIRKINDAKNAGIKQVNISLIIGLPYETKETVEETISLLKILPCDGAGINILDIYPATEAAEMLKNGRGGFRWDRGREMPWDNLSRSEVTIEVNDLKKADLLEIRERALRIMAGKRKRKKMDRIYKIIAYSNELLRENPTLFFKYAKDTIIGRK